MNIKHIVLLAIILVVTAASVAFVLPKSRKPVADDVPVVAADTPPDQLINAVKKDGPKTPDKVKPGTPPAANWEQIVKECGPAVASVEGKLGHGTGFMLKDNVLATNAHVINLEFEENIRIRFPSAAKKLQGPYKARYIWSDRMRDLAFLYVECDVPFLDLAEEYGFRPGQEILAIGNPGIAPGDKLDNSISKGLMSTVKKFDDVKFYQLSINVHPGNSGGPVLDAGGKVLGVVTAKARDKEGIAYAVPVQEIEDAWVKNVIGAGRATTPEILAWNRGSTVFERLIHLGDLYLSGLDANSRAMNQAVAQGGTPADGLRSVSKQVKTYVARSDSVWADALEKNLKIVVADEFLMHQDRDRIQRLWDTCREMKKLFESPNGTVASYEEKTTQLKRRFERLLLGDTRPTKPPKKSN